MTRYKALIQVNISDRYNRADSEFIRRQLTAMIDKVARPSHMIDGYDIAIEDLSLREGVYDYR